LTNHDDPKILPPVGEPPTSFDEKSGAMHMTNAAELPIAPNLLCGSRSVAQSRGGDVSMPNSLRVLEAQSASSGGPALAAGTQGRVIPFETASRLRTRAIRTHIDTTDGRSSSLCLPLPTIFVSVSAGNSTAYVSTHSSTISGTFLALAQ